MSTEGEKHINSIVAKAEAGVKLTADENLAYSMHLVKGYIDRSIDGVGEKFKALENRVDALDGGKPRVRVQAGSERA